MNTYNLSIIRIANILCTTSVEYTGVDGRKNHNTHKTKGGSGSIVTYTNI